jgi:selenocysteine-specific elongation factor
MRHIIAGTAGHIDHGKTALVRALTGIDTDRLAEEKRRGISIDLGFAHLEPAPGIRVGLVDVPGHERFVKNMLAGAAGIDLVLLVIAADESVKPQTREHFDICRLLGITKGIVVLTKIDAVDPDLLELTRLEAEEFVKGSFLDGAPVVPVSSVTGEGLEALRQALTRVAETVPARDTSQHFRLPVDRAFSMRGFGTVVTGTLAAGSLLREDEVEIHPTGKVARVRGLQVHGSAVEEARAGQRTAVNLAGVDAAELTRGMVLSRPSLLRPVQRLDVRLHLLPSVSPLKHRAPVHFHAHTAEVEAEVRLLETADAVPPGAAAYARILLRDPILLLPGDRFVLRKFSPVITIGGGIVIDIDAPQRLKRSQARDRLVQLDAAADQGDATRGIELLVRESSHGMSMTDLVARTGLLPAQIEKAASTSDRLLTLREPQFWLLDRDWLHATQTLIEDVLRSFHRDNPLAPGMGKQELRSRLWPSATAPAFLLDALLHEQDARGGSHGGAIAEGELVRLRSHQVTLQQDEEQAIEAILRAFEQAGLAAPAVDSVLQSSGVELKRARSLLQMLLRKRVLIRINQDLVAPASALEQLRATLGAHKGKHFEVSTFKDWTGLTRKYAIPILEYLDRERITRRVGDERVVM